MRPLLASLLVGSIALLAAPARAEPGPFLAVSAGLGLTIPATAHDVQVDGRGVYARADYLVWRDAWFVPKLYAGLLFTRPASCENAAPCDVSSQIVFAGGAGRLMVPIPYVGPFLELGLGVSLGRMTTRTGPVDVRYAGVTYHVPWAIGIAFGKRHEYELAFQYLEHPEQHQTGGGAAVGFAFRLGAPRED